MLLNYLKIYRKLRGGFWSKVTMISRAPHPGGTRERTVWQRGKVNCKERHWVEETEFYR